MMRISSILTLVIGCISITATAATAYSIPKRAVFEATSDPEFNDWGIWVSRLDGSEPERITIDAEAEGPGAENPVLSPDGLEVAFSRYEYHLSETCLEVMSINGGRSEPVYCSGSGDPEDVTWSPNGYKLAFSVETKSSESSAIYVLNLRTEELLQVADWFYRQDSPTFSPNGSQIAFETVYNPEEELARGIWVVNSDGTELQQLTNEGESEPSWSPDGSQIVVAAYNEEEINEDEGGLALINSSTGAHEKWLLDSDGPWESSPEWTTNGDTIFYNRWNEGGIFEEEEAKSEVGEINRDGTEEAYPLSEFSWAENFSPQKTTGGLEFDPSYLLTRYEPRLHYDMQEQYFADSAAEATDNSANRILDSEQETILAAHESPYVAPSLSLLAEPEVANGVIDEGPEYETDAAEMHATFKYGNYAYGRVYHDSETKAYWLDYWFYYYYDSQEVLGVGVHEGDWETVALRLDKHGIPDLAVYSRHGGESAACESSAVKWEVSDNNTISPNVYVANGSHANYFWPGEHPREFPRPTDDANGDGAVITPEVSEVESAPHNSSTALPRWFYWTGRWGASTGKGFESPPSPARNSDVWEDLQAFAEASEGNCDATGLGARPSLRQQSAVIHTQRASVPQPVPPKITARTSRNGIRIQYVIPNGGPTARYILLSVSAKNHLDATRTKAIRLRADHGIVLLPRPLATGPYVAAGSTFTAHKERSATRVANVMP
jgi:hypothetical protein